jgi:hypothetical protein
MNVVKVLFIRIYYHLVFCLKFKFVSQVEITFYIDHAKCSNQDLNNVPKLYHFQLQEMLKLEKKSPFFTWKLQE